MYTDYNEENSNENYYEESSNNNGKDKIKKIVILVLIFVVALILIVLLVKGCSRNNDGGSTYGDGNGVPSIAISRQTLTLEVGEGFELYADVLLANSDNPIVGWYSEDSSIVSVDDNGFVSGIKEGNANIVAVYRENNSVYSTKCSVTVTKENISLESINIIQENITLKKGKSILLEISFQPSDAKVLDLIYESDDSSVATVSQEGYVNAIGYGTTTIRVKTQDGTLSDTVTVSVIENGSTIISPNSLQLVGLTNGLSVGTTSQVLYILLPNNTTEKDLIWTSSDPNIATVNNGIVTGHKAGTCKIIASTTNNISSSIEVTVQSNNVSVQGITINGDTDIKMQTGETKVINYTITPDNATNKKVLYTTSNSNIVYVNSNGIMAAVSAGSAVITVTTEDGRKTATINITVTGESSGSSTSQTGSGSSESNSGSSSSSSSSGSSSDVSCSSNLMTYIKHNGSDYGAIISSVNFSQAKPFKGMSVKPVITFTQIADCLNQNKIYYYVYYGKTEDTISTSYSLSGTVKVNSTITLNKGDGYYKIKIEGYLQSDSTKKLTKYYYAIVQNNTANVINFNYKYYDYSSKLTYIDSSNNNLSSTRKLRYCLSVTSTCTPTLTSSYVEKDSSSLIIRNTELNQKVCAAIFENDVRVSDVSCIYTVAPTISVTEKVNNTNVTLTPKLNSSGSGTAKIYYCTSSSKCSLSTTSSQVSSGVGRTFNYGDNATYRYACFQAIDEKNNRSQKVCYDLINEQFVS